MTKTRREKAGRRQNKDDGYRHNEIHLMTQKTGT